MIVTVKDGCDAGEVKRELVSRGLWVERLEAGSRVLFSIAAGSRAIDARLLEAIAGVESVATPAPTHPKLDLQPSVVLVSGVPIGPSAAPVLMAGPCSVESESQIRTAAEALARAGALFLRGGAFKPRTSPYAFQGHGAKALAWMRRAADENGLLVVTEAMSSEDAPLVAEYADLVQIGSRSMQSYALLRAVGRHKRPVLLKRGMSATVEEWLLAAEYLLVHGAPSVVLCERGIRSFDSSTRNVLDLGAVALLSHVHRLPVIVDPSHALGRRDLVAPMARAAMAAGAAGLMIETHPNAGVALSDGPQALPLEDTAELARSIGIHGRACAPGREAVAANGRGIAHG